MGARQFDDMPEELRGCCALALDISSAGCFGQVDKACKELVEGWLASEKAAHEAPYVEFSSRHGQALAAMCRIPDGPKLIKFSDGGAKVFTFSCRPDKEFPVGRGSSNLARHLATRQHWKHWREAHGAQPTEAAWLAFAASLPGGWAPMFLHQRRV